MVTGHDLPQVGSFVVYIPSQSGVDLISWQRVWPRRLDCRMKLVIMWSARRSVSSLRASPRAAKANVGEALWVGCSAARRRAHLGVENGTRLIGSSVTGATDVRINRGISGLGTALRGGTWIWSHKLLGTESTSSQRTETNYFTPLRRRAREKAVRRAAVVKAVAFGSGTTVISELR